MHSRIARKAAAAAVGVGVTLAFAPAAADAAPNWRCTATPLSGSLLGQNLPLPTAGKVDAECANANATLPTLALPAPLTNLAKVSLLNGTTAANADGVFASAGLTDLSVGALPIPIPPIPVPDALRTIDVALPGVGPVPGVSLVQVDLSPAIAAISSLPSRNLLGAQALYSQVTGSCVGGKPSVTGTSRVLGAQVLGLDVDPNKVVDSAVNLVDTQNLALSQLNLSLAKVTLLGNTINVDTSVLLNALQGLNLPPIAVPAQVAQVKLTPSSQETVSGVLIQRALRAQISLAGQSIADLSIGQAAVGAGDVKCAADAAQSAPAAALECTKRKLTLIDVIPQGRRVRLYGAADKSLVGKTVSIRFLATGKTVAKVKVKKNGAFTTTAPMPARNVRNTNRARYIARASGEKSLNLKLARRMIVTRVKSSGGKVTIKGRVTKPLASPRATITLKRRVTCKKLQVVKRFKPKADGSFSVTVKSPKNLAATVYRLQTRVRKFSSNPKTYPTFTLPRAVDL